MKPTPMTAEQLISMLAKLPPKASVYLASDAEGNSFAPIHEIGHAPTGAVLLFPSDLPVDEDDLDTTLGSTFSVVYSAPRGIE